MSLIAGVDSSTQSVKVVVLDADSGEVSRQGRAAHPDATEVDPALWLSALGAATDGILDGVSALSIAGQQHGMVALDEAGAIVRPALLWNDTRSAPDAQDLVEDFGGRKSWADAVGSVPVASFTVTKARWMARVEPGNAARTAQILLPHDYLTWELAGRPAGATTDRGDASGTGYWSPAAGAYREDILALALGHGASTPRVASPSERVGTTRDGVILGPGTGDNMGAALGLAARPGDVIVSLGTSGTAFAVSSTPSADATGIVSGFADAAGRFLPLVCTLNAARVLTTAAALLGVDFEEFADLARRAAPGSGGLVLLPYLDGERTPNLPDARGSLHGITRANLTAENLARAAIEGMFGGLAAAVDALASAGVRPSRLLLIGGAAGNPAVLDVAATIFDVPIEVPPVAEYVALGAARQAAWALSGGSEPPQWSGPAPATVQHRDPAPVPAIREGYAHAWESLYG